nr:TNF receptor-associated factor 6-like isoform X2 [Dermacentor andersoni]XP_054924704.1 TNF receptor-associated factor 6-like isoform X2 [Dermacentor andersoni]
MPDQRRARLYRVRGHAVGGVNWRPTRFAEDVPQAHVCCLCGTISPSTVLLPCAHLLCEPCHGGSANRGNGSCPLDREPFEENDCSVIVMPVRKASNLRVYCWNEAHGCQYTGTVDRMLEHYENECKFHTVECLRCGEGVQHRELSTHYGAGCSVGVSSAITESSEHTARTLPAVNAALEDLKTMFGHFKHEQRLPGIQSQLKELTEQVTSQEAKFAEITRELGVSEHNLKSETAQIAAAISSTVSHQRTTLRNLAKEACTSSSLSLRSEQSLILRKLEHFTDLSLNAVEHFRQTSLQPDSSRIMAHCRPLNTNIRHLTSALSTTAKRIKRIGSVNYVLTLENCGEVIQWQGGPRKLAQITVWHMRDTYFTIAVWMLCSNSTCHIDAGIEFNGILEDSKCLPPIWHVMMWNSAVAKTCVLDSDQQLCSCKHDGNPLVHFHLLFSAEFNLLEIGHFLEDGKMGFGIALDRKEIDGGFRGAPNVHY